MQSAVANKQAEADHLAAQIGELEARSQGHGSADLRAEYGQLEKSVGSLRRERENLHQDLEISTMNPKEVHAASTRTALSYLSYYSLVY